MKKYRLWLYDFDGVFFDIVTAYRLHYSKIVTDLMGLSSHEALLTGLYDLRITSFEDFCTGMHGIAQEIGLEPKCTVEQMQTSWGTWPDIGRATPYLDGAFRALSLLARDNRNTVQAIISNRDEKSFARHRGKLEEMVDLICIDNGGLNFKPKPDPEMIIHACKYFGISPDYTIMIGDGEPDYLAAKTAGVDYRELLCGRPGKPPVWNAIRHPDLATLVDTYLAGQPV